MNNPTCAQCDCVASCQANPQACPNVVKTVPTAQDFGIPSELANRAENYANWKASQPIQPKATK